MSVGDRGKWEEGKVKAMLELYSNYSSFTFMRLPDARAGSRVPTLSDFQTMHKGQFALLEVKAVEHDYRLPHKNFDENKVARMRTWQMSGADAHVLVHFKTLKVWRYSPLDFFVTRQGGSWDMRGIPTITLSAAMEKMYGPAPNRI